MIRLPVLMASLRAIFYFEVGELIVGAAALGERYTFDGDGCRVTIELPRVREDFRPEDLAEGVSYSAFSGSSHGAQAGTVDSLGISVVKVTIDTEAEVSSADFTEDVVKEAEVINAMPMTIGELPEYPEPVERAIVCLDAAAKLADEVMFDFVTRARAHGQWWLGLSSEPVERGTRALLIDVSTGEELLGSTSSPQHFTMLGGQSPLGVDDLTRIEQALRAQSPAPVAEALLSDAKYLVAGRERGRTDPVRAVLMAAIACELKVKANLREYAPADQERLIDFVLDNPREVTLTAAGGLFDKFMEATQARSLRKEDRLLFSDIERLFATRNAIAHRGARPTIEDARALVVAADRAFYWLDGRQVPPADWDPLYARVKPSSLSEVKAQHRTPSS